MDRNSDGIRTVLLKYLSTARELVKRLEKGDLVELSRLNEDVSPVPLPQNLLYMEILQRTEILLKSLKKFDASDPGIRPEAAGREASPGVVSISDDSSKNRESLATSTPIDLGSENKPTQVASNSRPLSWNQVPDNGAVAAPRRLGLDQRSSGTAQSGTRVVSETAPRKRRRQLRRTQTESTDEDDDDDEDDEEDDEEDVEEDYDEDVEEDDDEDDEADDDEDEEADDDSSNELVRANMQRFKNSRGVRTYLDCVNFDGHDRVHRIPKIKSPREVERVSRNLLSTTVSITCGFCMKAFEGEAPVCQGRKISSRKGDGSYHFSNKAKCDKHAYHLNCGVVLLELSTKTRNHSPTRTPGCLSCIVEDEKTTNISRSEKEEDEEEQAAF